MCWFTFSYSCRLKLIIILCVQFGQTALRYAIRCKEIAELLVEKGANLDIQDEV